MAKLTIRYEPDPNDEVGRLWFDTDGTRFSGAAFFWSNLSEIPEMVAALRQYPVTEQMGWTWGYNSSAGDDLILSFSILPEGHTGSLYAQVKLADLHDLSNRLITTMKTDYASLERFSAELDAIVAQREGEAILNGW